MEQSLKRSIILEHYQNPKNKCLLNDDSYEAIITTLSREEFSMDEIKKIYHIKRLWKENLY